jgi:hypothetical protein
MNASDLAALASAHPSLLSAGVSALAGIVTLAALFAAQRAATGVSGLIGSFAAASLVAATLLHLLSEAWALSPNVGVFALGGFALVYMLAAVTSGSGSSPMAAALAPMVGIGVHSFLDGALHATVFAVGLQTGLAAAPGLVLHEVAETTLLFVLLLRAGLGRSTAAGLALLGAVATTPLGAFASEGTIGALPAEALGWALGAAAGSLIYLSVSHLAEGEVSVSRWPRFATFVAGAVLSAMLLTAPERSHNGHYHGRHAPAASHDHPAPAALEASRAQETSDESHDQELQDQEPHNQEHDQHRHHSPLSRGR